MNLFQISINKATEAVTLLGHGVTISKDDMESIAICWEQHKEDKQDMGDVVTEDKKRLLEIAETFERAERMGLPEDMPEGSRYIGVTDTLAKQLTVELRAIAERM